MLVEVVELRATGMKLTPEEVEAAPRHTGNLTITKDGSAFLHTGENPDLGQLLSPLFGAKLGTLRGDNFMLSGRQSVSKWSGEMKQQAWWCRALRGDHLPDVPLLKGRGPLGPPA
jgi:hypothetical protein